MLFRKADQSFNEEKLKSLGFSLDKLLISCTFNKINCKMSDFTWKYTNEFGSCYTFNDLLVNNETQSKATSKSGPEYGLNLELFYGIPGKLVSLCASI